MKKILILMMLLFTACVFGQVLSSDKVKYLHHSSSSTVTMDEAQSFTGTTADSVDGTFWVGFSNTGISSSQGFAGVSITVADTVTVALFAQPARTTSDANYVTQGDSVVIQFTLGEMKLAQVDGTADTLELIMNGELLSGTHFFPVGTRSSGESGWGPCNGLKFYYRWSEDTSTKGDTSIVFRAIGME